MRQTIAGRVFEMGRLEGDPRPMTLVDIGAGTGDIGLELVERGATYTGIDVSSGMLAVFRERAAARSLAPSLVVADACARWPLPDASTAVIFGSRSLHWVPPSHLADEAFRVARNGAVLLIGRVVREPDDPRERIRKEMRRLLEEAGYAGRSGGGRAREALSECERRGARPLPPRIAAEWTTDRRPSASVEDWRDKQGLAGVDLPLEVKEAILAGVARFAAREFVSPDAPVPVIERYVLEGVELAPRISG